MNAKAGGCPMSRMSLRSRWGALATFCALAASGPAVGQTYITFSPQDGTSTYASAINAAGVVAGSYCGDDACDGFVRAADGTITAFEGPTLTTVPTSINRKGSIAGSYFDDSGDGHGFLRKPDGKLIRFDPSGSTNTVVYTINDGGVITGYYNTHGFIRAADGTITTFDPSGSVGTVPTAINAKGDIAGYYWVSGSNAHGFLRMADGTITSFDVDGAQYTQAFGINEKDAIVGSGAGTIGFARTPGGKITTFAQGLPLTQASGINAKGQVAGFYTFGQAPYGHAYVGSPKSGFTNFDVPNGTQAQAFAINDSGVIAGSYYDANGNLDGFLRMP